MPLFKRTNDTLTTKELSKLFGFNVTGVYGSAQAVCDGEWRKQRNDVWRFWRNADL